MGGFALTFGALFAKTWRVHVVMISSMKTAKSKVDKTEMDNIFLLKNNCMPLVSLINHINVYKLVIFPENNNVNIVILILRTSH